VQQTPDPLLGHTHATIIPLLVGDFGRPLLGLSMAVFALFVQFGFLLLRDRGLIARFISVQFALYGGFWMFQDSMLGAVGVLLPITWLLLLIFADRFAHGSGFTAERLVVLSAAEATTEQAPVAAARPQAKPT
jgi:hypothetical protein